MTILINLIKQSFIKVKSFWNLDILNNQRVLLICKTLGSMCVLAVILNKHLYFNLNIAYVFLMLSIIYLFVVIVISLLQLFKGIKNIFLIKGIFNLINSLFALLSASFCLNKIYLSNTTILDNVIFLDNIYFLILLFIFIPVPVILFIRLNLKNYKFIDYIINVYIYINVFIGRFLLSGSGITLCYSSDDSSDINNNNNNNNTNTKTNTNLNNNTNFNKSENISTSSLTTATSNSNDKTGKINVSSGNKVEINNYVQADALTTAAGNVVSTVARNTLNEHLSQAITQFGLNGAIVGGMSVGAAISKGQPPATRVVTTVATGVGAGAAHVGLSAMNRALNPTSLTRNLSSDSISQNKGAVNSANNSSVSLDTASHSCPPSPKGGFIDSPNEEFSIKYLVLEMLNDNTVGIWLASILVLATVNLILLIFLLITVLSKYFLSLNYQFNWVDGLFSPKNSVKVKSFLHNIIKLLVKIRELNIIMYIIILIVLSTFMVYFLFNFYINFEYLCKLYLDLKNK